jgi:hypothetical protein
VLPDRLANYAFASKILAKEEKEDIGIGFVVLTTLPMKNVIFWDIMPCYPGKVNRLFGGTYRLQARNQHETDSELAWLTFRP